MGTPRTDRAIAGIVLAGGQSRRMGRDKAMLPWNDASLLAHMRALLLQAGAEPVRVSGAYPAFGGVEDMLAGQGPLGGLHSVLRTLPDGIAWVVPVDMPRLDVSLLHQLREAPPAACVIFAGQPLPMRLRVDAATRAQLDQMLAGAHGPRSLHALQESLGVLALDPDEHASARLTNCNTPEQWKELVS
ncbi:molybdenum cofactor guanylyltransferase [Stenotrophomonas sp. ISL-67]|uniref:molybdenum cofactor guanylyltransferase n=1 Tax=Stenotrophomonas sp. ISL-67 TaxID=2819171 RepID=UPI001BEAD6A5|nr:molybdenum cofactor guanylyltransferase [Stenotrophomonas sp. ISL-67]MBT2767392.1 molybdenum cofactor guanylyltransferase [Stenotrophomonas sp. ISL-67]